MHPEDVTIMDLVKKLKKLSEDSNKEKLVKLYLLDCCEKLVRFRTSGCLSTNLIVARRFLKGSATQIQVHRAEWELEGEAFGVELYSKTGARAYFRSDKNIKSDLLRVRISKGLSNQESRKYLEGMAYFIDRVFCHIEYTPNWFFTDDCEEYLCSKLFLRYFGANA